MNMLRNAMIFCLLAFGFALKALATPVTYYVTVNTSSLSGTIGSLDLNFNPGPLTTQTASVQILSFSSDGSPSTPTVAGHASGALPGALAFDNGTALNDYFGTFTFGSTMTFEVSLSGTALTAPDGKSAAGSTFAFSIFSDSAGSLPALTSNTSDGFAFIVNVNLDGTTTLTNYAPNLISIQLPGVVTVTPASKSLTSIQSLATTVVVSGGSGNPTPTGSITLTGGTYTSAATALNNGSASITIPAGSLPSGTDTLTATYTGDTNYIKETGTSSVTVTQVLPTVIVTPSAQSITTFQALTTTVAVSGGSGNPTPSGDVTLSSGSYTSAATLLTSGSATVTIPAGTLPSGTDTLTATYIGDANYIKATGTTSVVVVAPGLAVSGTSVSFNSGATSGDTSAVTVTPLGGFTGTVTLTAAITSSPTSAQYPPTLSFGSTSPVVITGASPGTATLTISTSGNNTATVRPVRSIAPWYRTSGATLALLLFFGIRRRGRRLHQVLTALFLLITLGLGLSGCAHSNVNKTTPGTYVITVTAASGSLTSQGTVTLTVQ